LQDTEFNLFWFYCFNISLYLSRILWRWNFDFKSCFCRPECQYCTHNSDNHSSGNHIIRFSRYHPLYGSV